MRKTTLYRRAVQVVNIPGLILVVAWYVFYFYTWRGLIAVGGLGFLLRTFAADQEPDKSYFHQLLADTLPIVSFAFWSVTIVYLIWNP